MKAIKTSDLNTKLLEDIKKLLILDLLNKGITQETIGATIGVTQSSISRMAPKGFKSNAK